MTNTMTENKKSLSFSIQGIDHLGIVAKDIAQARWFFGTIRYHTSGLPLAGVTVRLDGPAPQQVTTNSAGQYTVTLPSGAAPGPWTLRPTKTTDSGRGVTQWDAVLVLKAVAGLQVLTLEQQLAAQVLGTTPLGAFEATQILKFAAQLLSAFPAESRCGTAWWFLPKTASAQTIAPDLGSCQAGAIRLPSLTTALTNLDFTAVELGDVSGDWTPSTP